jgi:hypothetical protein
VVEGAIGVMLQERAIISVILVVVLVVTAFYMFRDLKNLQRHNKAE